MWEIIEEKLKEKGMSQYELAKKMEVHTSVISELKLGRIKKPSFELVCKIADALEIQVDQLR
nr:MAG TPA: Helix-turn-helix XRE-family like protein [Caudoviricetes sp.]